MTGWTARCDVAVKPPAPMAAAKTGRRDARLVRLANSASLADQPRRPKPLAQRGGGGSQAH